MASSPKVKSTSLKAGMKILASVTNFSDGMSKIYEGKTSKESQAFTIQSVTIEAKKFLRGRGVNGKKSSTDVSCVVLTTTEGQKISVSKRISLCVVE